VTIYFQCSDGSLRSYDGMDVVTTNALLAGLGVTAVQIDVSTYKNLLPPVAPPAPGPPPQAFIDAQKVVLDKVSTADQKLTALGVVLQAK